MENINMGIGKLGAKETIFSRKFRWLLRADNLPQDFVKSVSFDHVNKIIKLSYYDVFYKGTGMHALTWAGQLHNEKLTFTAFDGAGKSLYSLVFENLMLVGHEADFDYSISDIACTNLTISYKVMHKHILYSPDNSQEKFTGESEVNYLQERIHV